MATNIIYKGELNGTQVDFQTGSLTDISTFDTDVRSSAIQDSITNGVTDRGASQDAIHTMSGVLASLSNHPDITPASNIAIDNSSGIVLQDASFTFDSDGHVTAASFNSTNLDDRYFTEAEVTGISGSLQSQITSNDGNISANASSIATNTGNISANATSIAANAASIATNTGNISANATSIAANAASIATNTGNIAVLQAATGHITGLIISNDAELTTLRQATGVLEGQIDDLQANSGVPNLDAVTTAGSSTANDITVGDIRVGGGNITGPATITIDPDAAGASGKVIIAGDLQVDGTTTTINSTSVQIDDLSLVLGTGAPNAASADGGGIIIDGTGVANIAEFTFDGTNNRWKTNSIAIEADIVGNASTASGWVADSRIELDGDLGGHVDFNAGMTGTLTATIANDAVQAVHLNNDIAGDNITITNGELSVADGDIRAAVFPSTSVLDASKALVSDSNGKVSVASNVSSTELSYLSGVSSNIQSQLNAKADDSTEMSASDGLTGGGTLAADRSFSTTADQGHLDEIELGTSNTLASNAITKGGILILRGTDNNGITTSGSDGNAVALNDKTTVAFEGVVQSARMDQDSDNGSYVAMWKIQGVIRRDSDSTNMLSSFVTKTFAGSNASSYGLSVSVSGNGLKINSDQTSSNLTTSATINYNWIEDTSA